MKKIYVVFQANNGEYCAAHYQRPWCPLFGSFGSRGHAVRAAADRMCLPVREYSKLPAVK